MNFLKISSVAIALSLSGNLASADCLSDAKTYLQGKYSNEISLPAHTAGWVVAGAVGGSVAGRSKNATLTGTAIGLGAGLLTYFMGRADKRYTKSSAEELRDLLEDTQAGNMNSESVKKLRNRLSDDFSDAELVKGLKLGNSSKYLCEGSGYNVRFLSTGGIAAFLEKKAHAGVLMINDKTSQQNSNPAKSQKDETPSGAVDESKPTAGRI